MQLNKPKASVVVLIILACLSAGCRVPNWYAYHSLGKVPCSADESGRSYFEKQSVGNSTENPGARSNTPAVHSSPAEAPLKSQSEPNNRANISAAPGIQLASHIQGETPKKPAQGLSPLKLPEELPGADTPPITLPSRDAQDKPLDPIKKKENILKLYPDLTELPIEPDALPDASNGLISLEELHRIARENHPGLRAAAASVEATRGLMIQAGLPPNPNLGYEADTVRTLNTPGYHGAYLQQTFITAKKLGLAARAAAVDYANAEVNQRKTWVTVQSSVRRAYFQVLAARKRVVLARALNELSENAYLAQINLVTSGEAAPYEPFQLRVLTTQARASLIRSQQESIAAWRTLAANVAVPTLQPMELEGRVDCPVPEIEYEPALAQMISVHTDLQIAENLIGKNRTLVTLADKVPIPDINLGFVLQRDYTFTPGTTTYNMTLGGAVPVWNKNQGNRIAARAELIRSMQLALDAQNQLIVKLAPIYGTYQTNRQLAKSFRSEALSDQVRAYRGIYQRYMTDPSGISFSDVIVAQQTVASVLNQYIDILQSQWQSTVELGELLQVDDLFQMGTPSQVAEIPSI